MMRRVVLPAMAFVLGSVLTCSGLPFGQPDAGSPPVDPPDAGPAPLYAADATDEAWRSMVDARASTEENAAKGSTFTSPTEGQTISGLTPFTFTWTTPLIAMGPGPRPFSIGLFSTAHAHGTPVTGDIYWIFFTVPGVEQQIIVLSTEGSWTPDEDTWAKLKMAGNQDIRAEIISAYMTENRVTDGPYKAPGVRRFRIQ